MMTFTTIFWFLIIGGVIFMMMKKGGGCCGTHDHGGGHGGHGGHDHGAMMHGKAEEVKEVEAGKDPVCGMDVGNSEVFSSYNGKKYTFCSDSCRKTFEAEPGKFAS